MDTTTPANRDQLIDAIDELPGDEGWWRISSRDQIITTADRLLDAGLAPGVVFDVIATMYSAVASEYGD